MAVAELHKRALNQAQLNQANLANLISLWQCYGAQQLNAVKQYQLAQNNDWPHRVWLNKAEGANHYPSALISNSQLISALHPLRSGSIFPVWPANLIDGADSITHSTHQAIGHYVSRHWTLSFQQTAMYLTLNHEIQLPECNMTLSINRISTNKDIEHWVDIGSKAFGYQINFQVIQQLSRNSDIQLLLAKQDQTPIACGLLYQTGKIIGIHQVGMAPEFQGQGLARPLMIEMIKRCVDLDGDYAVLQASTAGKPLYKKLGFNEQFIIDNYQKL